MEKNKKNSPKDKETSKNENKLKDKNILPPKIFSSNSQNKLQNSKPKNDKNTKGNESKSANHKKSTNSVEKVDDNENDEESTCKKEHLKPNISKQKPKAKASHFEDDILAELKREFPTKNSKSKRRVRYEDEKEDEDEPDSGQKSARGTEKPKARARSDAIKGGLHTEPELPDMPSKDIIVEKRGEEVGQNLMGDKGFVSSLLFDVISQENVYPVQESKSKPVSKQNLLERQSTIMDVASDIGAHFEKKDKSKSVTFLSAKKRAIKSKTSVSVRHLQKSLESQLSLTTKSQTLPPELQHLKSGWQPTEEDEETPQVGFRQRKQSWVGTYVDGRDYWSKKESSFEQEEVPFEIDQRGQTWYDLPVADEVQIEIPTKTQRTLSRAKFDAVKMQPPEELAECADEEKKRLFSFDDREPIPEKISSDLYQMFLEFCKTDDLSAVQNRLSLLNADRSLEKVGLLDHKKLTVVHTGLCFKAAGGGRYRGLSFAQYKLFIEMVAETRKMPVFDFVNRLKLGYAGIIVLPDDQG